MEYKYREVNKVVILFRPNWVFKHQSVGPSEQNLDIVRIDVQPINDFINEKFIKNETSSDKRN